MPSRSYRRIWLTLALSLALMLSACGDDDPGTSGIASGNDRPRPDRDGSSVTDTADTGYSDSRQSDTAQPDVSIIDEQCEGKTAGSGCALPNASGVCIDARCQFLSCESGYRSCDGDEQTGCETDITRPESCGACGVTCSDPEQCQLSRAGWICSSTPVCPSGRYDLDGDHENGCEWQMEPTEEGTFAPVTLVPQTSALTGAEAFSVAGVAEDARLLSQTALDSPPAALALGADDDTTARTALAIPEDLVAIGWTDAITLSKAGGSTADDSIFTPDCAEREDIRCHIRGLSADDSSTLFAADAQRVYALGYGPDCADEPTADSAARALCDEPHATFAQADYLAAFFPDIDDSTGTDLPELQPIGLHYLAAIDRLVVFTRRGFFVLRLTAAGFEPTAHLEAPHAAQDAPPSYVAGAAAKDGTSSRIYLLREDDTLRSFRLEQTGQGAHIEPAGPDIGLDILTDAGAHHSIDAGADGVLLVSDGRQSWLVRPAARSGRVVALEPPTDLFTDERVVFGTAAYDALEAGFSVLYFELGRYYLQRVLRR
ncbi:MAG: hypothetical protein ACLFVJ_18815 [Persicimonas sp.]